MASVINTIEFGIENLHLAPIKESDKTYETPVAIKGIVSVSLTSSTSSKNIYADNGIYYSFTNNNGYEGELEIYNYDDEFKVKYFGYSKDKNGVLIEPDVITPKPYAMAFRIRGDKNERTSVFYHVVFQKPDITHKTIEEEIEVEAMKVKFNAYPVAFDGFAEKIVQSSTTDKAQQATWFTKIYTPTKLGV